MMLSLSFYRTTWIMLSIGSFSLIHHHVHGADNDLFNYGYTSYDDLGRQSYGQPNWGDITCSTPECVCILMFGFFLDPYILILKNSC